MKIAVWSGPRNLSTALMYSFGNRSDFEAMDEPFYAPYLRATGLSHPMGAQIMERHDTDPAKVAAACAATPAQHRYMKHMPHHMVDGFPLDWAKDCVNIHLIRHPARVIASYAAKRESPTLDDIGYAQQVNLFNRVGGIVIDSYEIRENPMKALRNLCSAINLPFRDEMVSWPAGPKLFDGIWARHWYGAVHLSTQFAGPEGPLPELCGAHVGLLEDSLRHYETLKSNALPLNG